MIMFSARNVAVSFYCTTGVLAVQALRKIGKQSSFQTDDHRVPVCVSSSRESTKNVSAEVSRLFCLKTRAFAGLRQNDIVGATQAFLLGWCEMS